MSSPMLFTPIEIGNLKLSNRIVIAPMAQYSSENGQMNDWHLMHLGQLANSGAAALTIEGAAVSPEGRTSYADIGLYSDETEASIARVLHGVRRWSNIPIGIQLNHAGRKGSRQKLWDGGVQIPPNQPNGWKTNAPSPIAFSAADTPPVALERDDLTAVRNAFADAARRASRLGLDFIQILGGHGYLVHQFLSPLSNRRDTDAQLPPYVQRVGRSGRRQDLSGRFRWRTPAQPLVDPLKREKCRNLRANLLEFYWCSFYRSPLAPACPAQQQAITSR
jgi:2,4-dienoyl-CoA reductase-like NADH-dependent reductase (Old Yellow Enzyme family)